MPPDAEDWGDQLASKTMEIAPTGMVVAVRGTRRSSRRNQIDNIEPAGRYPVVPGSYDSWSMGLGVPHLDEEVTCAFSLALRPSD